MNVSIAVFIPLDFSGFYVCCLFNIFSLVWGLGTGRFKFLIFPPPVHLNLLPSLL